MPCFSRTYRIALLCFCLLLVLSLQSSAFDGTRKGFVLGIGASYAPLLHWNWDNERITNSAGGGGFTLLGGYAFSSHDMIVYQGIVSGREVEELDPIDGAALVEFINTIAYYRYFGPQGRALYVTGGLGMASYKTEFNTIEGDGFGYTFGAGVEFTKQVQFGLQYFGSGTSGHTRDARLDVLQLTLTVVAY